LTKNNDIGRDIAYARRIAGSILCPRRLAYLILFVTDRCNARCRMCFSHEGMADKRISASYPLLSLKDMEKLLSQPELKYLAQFTLSGGEPFLREDIEDIINLYGRLHPDSRITIPTNGLMTGRIERIMGRIVPGNPGLQIGMPLTVLGVGRDHEEMTGVRGHFRRLRRTVQALQPLRRYGNFKVGAVTVLSRHNEGYMDEVMEFFHRSASLFDTFNILLARGDARDPEATEVDPAVYVASRRKLPDKGVHIRLLVRTLWRLVDHELEYGSMDIRCNAGKKLIVVSERGDVSPCELLYRFRDPYFGNLHDHDFALGELLNTQKARGILKFIENRGCHCTFECAILSSMTFTPGNYGSFMKTLWRDRRSVLFSGSALL